MKNYLIVCLGDDCEVNVQSRYLDELIDGDKPFTKVELWNKDEFCYVQRSQIKYVKIVKT